MFYISFSNLFEELWENEKPSIREKKKYKIMSPFFIDLSFINEVTGTLNILHYILNLCTWDHILNLRATGVFLIFTHILHSLMFKGILINFWNKFHVQLYWSCPKPLVYIIHKSIQHVYPFCTSFKASHFMGLYYY